MSGELNDWRGQIKVLVGFDPPDLQMEFPDVFKMAEHLAVEHYHSIAKSNDLGQLPKEWGMSRLPQTLPEIASYCVMAVAIPEGVLQEKFLSMAKPGEQIAVPERLFPAFRAGFYHKLGDLLLQDPKRPRPENPAASPNEPTPRDENNPKPSEEPRVACWSCGTELNTFTAPHLCPKCGAKVNPTFVQQTGVEVAKQAFGCVGLLFWCGVIAVVCLILSAIFGIKLS